VQLDTLLPDAAFPVPEGHGIGAMLELYFPLLGTVKLFIRTSLTRLSTFTAPGQYLLASAVVLHRPMSLTALELLPMGAPVIAYPGRIEEHDATLFPDAVFEVPTGQVIINALELKLYDIGV
jgi:hypothetical protein